MHIPDWEEVKKFLEGHEKMPDLKNEYLASSKESKFKFRLEMAKTPKHALQLDAKEQSNLWKEAIQTELDQINEYNTFRILDNDEHVPPGYKMIPYYFVFDIKIEGRRKARLVAGGHRTEPSKEDTYSGVVSLEGVRMGFVLPNMNCLMVHAGDVGNEFLYGKT